MSRSALLLILLGWIPAAPVLALDTTTRMVSPVMEWGAADLERFDEAWIYVKFVEGANVIAAQGRFLDAPPAGAATLDMGRVNQCLAAEAVTEMEPTFDHDRTRLREWKARGEMRAGVVGPDLSLWFNVRVDGGHAAVARLVNALNACPEVEIAHPAAIPETAGFFTAGEATAPAPAAGERLPTPDFSGQQGYLYATPNGLDAPSVWAVPGGKGAGVKFLDVELCWTLDHEDFDAGGPFYVGGATMDPGYEYHGTPVLGEVIGQHNGYGVNGFAPDVQFGVVAVTVAEWPNVPHYFQEAVDQLDAGDLWLIELQMYPAGFGATPMEWMQVNYDVIWTSSWSLGIICIEAGANGGQDLDDPAWGGVFDRTLRDSGAIMVAAGRPNSLTAESFTNYGSRLDLHAWGSSIVSTGGGDLYNGGTLQTRYTATFGGTSGASPMIAGSVAALQGVVKAHHPEPYSPLEMRTLLRDTGTPHVDPYREIGPRPDLGAAVAQISLFSAIDSRPATTAAPRLLAANPYRPHGQIRLLLPVGQEAAGTGRTELAVFDLAGRRIRTLHAAPLAGHDISVSWDGVDATGWRVTEGVYFLRLAAQGVRADHRILLVR